MSTKQEREALQQALLARSREAQIEQLYKQPLTSANAIRERKRAEMRLKGWSDAELDAIEYRSEPPEDDLDARPHGSDRFGNACECDDCERWDVAKRHGHREDQLAFSVYVLLACLGVLIVIVAAWQAGVRP